MACPSEALLLERMRQLYGGAEPRASEEHSIFCSRPEPRRMGISTQVLKSRLDLFDDDRLGRAGEGRLAQDLVFNGGRVEHLRFSVLTRAPVECRGGDVHAGRRPYAAMAVDPDAQHARL